MFTLERHLINRSTRPLAVAHKRGWLTRYFFLESFTLLRLLLLLPFARVRKTLSVSGAAAAVTLAFTKNHVPTRRFVEGRLKQIEVTSPRQRC